MHVRANDNEPFLALSKELFDRSGMDICIFCLKWEVGIVKKSNYR